MSEFEFTSNSSEYASHEKNKPEGPYPPAGGWGGACYFHKPSGEVFAGPVVDVPGTHDHHQHVLTKGFYLLGQGIQIC